MFKIIFCENIISKNKFDEKNIGLTLINKKEYLRIYSDPFKTETLYFLRLKNKIFLTVKPEKLLENLEISNQLEIDKVAFNETIIFGSPLLNRTIFKQIKQLPAGSYLEINKFTGENKISKYFNFNFYKDENIKNINQAVNKLHEFLIVIFKKLDKKQNYVMGLSGGLDSRLSLSLIRRFIDNEKIKLFTFGFDERILEYSSAKKIAKELGCDQLQFHRLTNLQYIEALNYLPRDSLGQISINNCHITSFLKSQNERSAIQISNYFSDAIFGYSTFFPKKKFDITDNKYFKILERSNIEEPLYEEIREDVKKLCSEFDQDSNYSSIDEYLYLTERNPKFHFNLASCQSIYNKTIFPYANIELTKFLISLPLEFRHQKLIIDEYFNLLNPNLSNKKIYTISSRFSSIYGGRQNFVNFRALNFSNALLRKLNINYQFLNIYQTENQEFILRQNFKKDLKDASYKFFEYGLINKKQREEYKKIPFRSQGVNKLFNIISLNKLVN